MIHRIDHINQHLYRRELADLHQQRAACFIDERGWPLQRTDEGEFDEYDDAQAVHLVAFDDAGGVAAACRIRPTEGGGLIPDHFPHLIAAGADTIRTAGTYECTRYFCAPGLRGHQGMAARSALHVAMIEHVRGVRGDRLVGFVDLPLLTHLRRFSGLRIAPIGTPHAYDDGALTIAFEIGVTSLDLVETAGRLGLSGRQLFVAPPWVPAHADLHRWAQTLALLSDERTATAVSESLDMVRAGEQRRLSAAASGAAA